MEVQLADCPLGAKCEEVKNINNKQVLFRCPWYVKLIGQNPQTGDSIDEYGCAVAWTPVILTEVSKEVRQGAAATESFRNIMFRLAQGETPAEIERSYNKDLLNGG